MEDQGIMALPNGGMQAPTAQPVAPMMDPAAEAAFEQARMQADPKEVGDALLEEARKADPTAVDEFIQALSQINLPPEVIDALGQMVDAVLAEPEKYQEIRAEFIKEGVPEELLPPQFDAAYFSALNMALDQLSARAAPAQPMMPQAFAQGGIVSMRPIAAELSRMGRNGDTMLAHVTPAEMRMLRRRGGSGTINPVTGLPEFFFKSVAKAVGGVVKGIGKAVKGVVNGVKKFAQSSVGRIVTAVALGFFLGPAAASMLNITSVAGVAAMSGFVGGFGSTMLAGGNFKDALKTGAVGAVTAGVTAGVSQGFNTAYQGPTTVSGQFDRFTDTLKSLGTSTPGQAAVQTPSTVSATEGITTPSTVSATAPTVPMTPDGAIMYPGQQAGLPQTVDMASVAGRTATDVTGGIGNLPQAEQFIGPPEPTTWQRLTGGQDIGSSIQGTAQDLGQGVKNFFAAEPTAADLQAEAVKRGYPSYAAAPEKVQLAIEKAASPTFGTTSRVIGTGLTGLALTGGFNPEPAEKLNIAPTETGYDLLRRSPEIYGVTVGGGRTVYPNQGIMAFAKGGYAGKAAKFESKATKLEAKGKTEKANLLRAKADAFTARDIYGSTDYISNPPTELGRAAGDILNPAYEAFYNRFKTPGSLNLTEEGIGQFIDDRRADENRRAYRTRFFTEAAQLLAKPDMYIQDPNYVEEDKTIAATTTVAQPTITSSPAIVSVGGTTVPTIAVGGGTASAPLYTPSQITPGPLPNPLINAPDFSIMAPSPVNVAAPAAPQMTGAMPANPYTPATFTSPEMYQWHSPAYATSYGLAAQGNPYMAEPTRMFAQGGIAAVAPRRYNMGGYAGGGQPRHFPRRTGQISGPGTGTSDDIPAMLSDGEFVMTAKAVRGAGGGSRREGAKRMYQMMRAFERKA